MTLKARVINAGSDFGILGTTVAIGHINSNTPDIAIAINEISRADRIILGLVAADGLPYVANKLSAQSRFTITQHAIVPIEYAMPDSATRLSLATDRL